MVLPGSIAALALCVANAAAIPAAALLDDDALAALLERARAAHGVAKFAATRKELVLEGRAAIDGMEGARTTRLAADGRFVTATATRLQRRVGFDGRQAWLVDAGGIPRPAWFAEREVVLLQSAVSFGAWCLENGPVVVLAVEPPEKGAATQPAAGAATYFVRLRARDGELEAKLEVDARTALPTVLHLSAAGVDETWIWSGWHEAAAALTLPAAFSIEDDGERDGWRLDAARLVDPDPATFALPSERPHDTTFNAARPARLEGHATRSRHVVVKARLDGADLGWFIFDSGAGATCIDPQAADELRLPVFGETKLGGAGANRLTARFRSSTTITVGPVTIDHPFFVELEMDQLGSALGEKLAGICGYDLLQRVVAVVDMKGGTVDLFDPATFAKDGVTWRDLVLAGNHPHVRGTFENEGEEEGLFRLDTGAGSMSVLFHAPYVQKLGLLQGRETFPFAGTGGVGGASKTRAGRLAWFELGGQTIDDLNVLFCQDEAGAFADPWTAGTIGSTVLSRFDLILDYPHGRIGFVAHDPDR